MFQVKRPMLFVNAIPWTLFSVCVYQIFVPFPHMSQAWNWHGAPWLGCRLFQESPRSLVLCKCRNPKHKQSSGMVEPYFSHLLDSAYFSSNILWPYSNLQETTSLLERRDISKRKGIEGELRKFIVGRGKLQLPQSPRPQSFKDTFASSEFFSENSILNSICKGQKGSKAHVLISRKSIYPVETPNSTIDSHKVWSCPSAQISLLHGLHVCITLVLVISLMQQ